MRAGRYAQQRAASWALVARRIDRGEPLAVDRNFHARRTEIEDTEQRMIDEERQARGAQAEDWPGAQPGRPPTLGHGHGGQVPAVERNDALAIARRRAPQALAGIPKYGRTARGVRRWHGPR